MCSVAQATPNIRRGYASQYELRAPRRSVIYGVVNSRRAASPAVRLACVSTPKSLFKIIPRSCHISATAPFACTRLLPVARVAYRAVTTMCIIIAFGDARRDYALNHSLAFTRRISLRINIQKEHSTECSFCLTALQSVLLASPCLILSM